MSLDCRQSIPSADRQRQGGDCDGGTEDKGCGKADWESPFQVSQEALLINTIRPSLQHSNSARDQVLRVQFRNAASFHFLPLPVSRMGCFAMINQLTFAMKFLKGNFDCSHAFHVHCFDSYTDKGDVCPKCSNEGASAMRYGRSTVVMVCVCVFKQSINKFINSRMDSDLSIFSRNAHGEFVERMNKVEIIDWLLGCWLSIVFSFRRKIRWRSSRSTSAVDYSTLKR